MTTVRFRGALALMVAVGAIGLVQSFHLQAAAQRSRVPQQRPTFRTGVELVQVDVVVLDQAGKPVTGLTAADFTLFDRGDARPIATFSEIAHEWADDAGVPKPPADVRADVADNTSAQSERLVILVIDDLNLWIERVELAKRLAHRIVDEMGPAASMAVVFTSGEHSVEVTQDRAALHAAIDDVEGAHYTFRSSRRIIDTLQQVAKAIGAETDQRRKAVVVLSEWHSTDTRGTFAVDRLVDAPIGSSIGGADVAAGELSSERQSIEMLRLMRELRHANIALYGIDPRGRLQTLEERSRESRGENPVFRMDDPLYVSQQTFIETTEAAGGFAIVDTNDFDAGLDRIVADLDHYYVLGFYPEDVTDTSWHGLQVQVGQPSLSIRHRSGYQLGHEPEPPKNADPLVAVAAGVLPRTGLPLRVFAAPAAQQGKDARVAVTAEVRVPAERLTRPGGRLEDTVTLTLLAVDLGRTKVTRTLRQQVDVTIPRSGVAEDGTVAYQVVLGIDLPPASYQLRVSAQSARLDEVGSAYLPLVVPDVGKVRVAIAGPTVGYGPDSETRPAVTLAEQGLLAPGLDPVLDRTFSAADTVRLHYRIWRRDARTLVATRLVVEDAEGRLVLERHTPAGPLPGGEFEVSLPLFGFTPGGYRVRLTAEAGEYSATQTVGFAVRSRR